MACLRSGGGDTCRLLPRAQVYVLEVTWSEGTKTIIYRRYSRFFEFQVSGLLS